MRSQDQTNLARDEQQYTQLASDSITLSGSARTLVFGNLRDSLGTLGNSGFLEFLGANSTSLTRIDNMTVLIWLSIHFGHARVPSSLVRLTQVDTSLMPTSSTFYPSKACIDVSSKSEQPYSGTRGKKQLKSRY